MREKLSLRVSIVWILAPTDYPDSSMVVDYLSAESEVKNIGVACIYLNHKEAEVQTLENLLSGLWRQLIFGKDVGSLAKKFYQQHSEKGTKASLAEVLVVLRPVIAQYSKVSVVVDAIDEYPEAQRQILLHHLGIIGTTVNVMITSRPHIIPDASLPNLSAVEIRATEEDLRQYVDAQIRMSSRLSMHVQSQADLREEIHAKITGTVDGM